MCVCVQYRKRSAWCIENQMLRFIIRDLHWFPLDVLCNRVLNSVISSLACCKQQLCESGVCVCVKKIKTNCVLLLKVWISILEQCNRIECTENSHMNSTFRSKWTRCFREWNNKVILCCYNSEKKKSSVPRKLSGFSCFYVTYQSMRIGWAHMKSK